MTDCRVRGARAGDRAAIQDVTLSAYQQYASVIPALWDAYRENILATLGAADPQTQIVAEKDERIVGAVLLFPAGATIARAGGGTTTLRLPEVRLLAVAPSARSQGVGAILMGECARRARESGAGAITLHTTDMMQAAMRLYARLGFQRAPELDFTPAPGVNVKGYRLDLT